MTLSRTATCSVLLKRQALVFVASENQALSTRYLEAFEANLADIGYVISTRLRHRLQTLSAATLTSLQDWLWITLLETIGGNQRHQPFFRRFPEGVPADTFDLWCRKVLSHFMQEQDQPCLFCGHVGTTHVLNPCRHVVCEHCFDGSNYSACPVCEHHVDTSSPFFKPSTFVGKPNERVRLKRLDLGGNLDSAAKELFQNFCQRKQAMSPSDRDDLKAIIGDYRAQVLDWLPEEFPVRESSAIVFGTLLQTESSDVVMAAAKPFMNTATDVLRLVAAYSGTDPSLQGQTVYRQHMIDELRGIPKYKNWFHPGSWWNNQKTVDLSVVVNRFKVARIPRGVRKQLLQFLESLSPESLTEDMLRYRSYWIWLGQFLHPHEYKTRFPNTSFAFEVIRKKAPDGTRAPQFQGYYSKLETAIRHQDTPGMLCLLKQRPGEFARRYDHLLRLSGNDETRTREAVDTFNSLASQFSTPVLLTLRALLPTRVRKASARIYWPKGQVAKGVLDSDKRSPLAEAAVAKSVATIDAELLSRFANKLSVDHILIDEDLKNVIAPFNERTASRSAIQLPRGSTINVTLGKKLRLFLHWCEPQGGFTTDLDLSVGFYDENWAYLGVCSYYQLQFNTPSGVRIATSAGDLRSAPCPDGATEFVDFDLDVARKDGVRYAVAVLNNYSGMAFEQLERAFAGLMLRDDVHGAHFDPRTVELKFDLQGGNGVFLPFVLDVAQGRLHWLDVYSTGNFAFNNVASSNSAITTICPVMMQYFSSGVRLSMYELLLFHAAARAKKVTIRSSNGIHQFHRREGEGPTDFLNRLRNEKGNVQKELHIAPNEKVIAALVDGDLELTPSSEAYVLKPNQTKATLTASDLIA